MDNYRKSGFKFHTQHELQKYSIDHDKEILDEIVYGNRDSKPKLFTPDLVYHFDSKIYPNTGIINSAKYQDEIGKNDRGQIDVNQQQKTQLKFVFAAGSCSATNDAANHINILHPSFADSYFQGEIAAYNILGLKMPNFRTSYNYFNLLGKTFHQVGAKSLYDECYTHGSKDDLSFISFFAIGGNIISAFGSEEFAKEVMMIKEAFNSGFGLSIENLKRDQQTFFHSLYEKLSDVPMPSCRRKLIFDKRNNVVMSEVIWKDRDQKDDIYAQKFANYKQMTLED